MKFILILLMLSGDVAQSEEQLDPTIEAMLLSHDMGCRRASIAFDNKATIEQVIAKCKEVTDVYKKDIDGYIQAAKRSKKE